MSRRPCWQPNLIAIRSKRTAFGISREECPLIYGGIIEKVRKLTIFYVILSMYIHDDFSFSQIDSDPKSETSIPSTLKFSTLEDCEQELANKKTVTSTLSRNLNDTLVLSAVSSVMTVQKSCSYIFYID